MNQSNLISFTDDQMRIVTEAAAKLRPELRSAFLECVAAQLRIRTVDLQDAISRAMTAVVCGTKSKVDPHYWLRPAAHDRAV